MAESHLRQWCKFLAAVAGLVLLWALFVTVTTGWPPPDDHETDAATSLKSAIAGSELSIQSDSLIVEGNSATAAFATMDELCGLNAIPSGRRLQYVEKEMSDPTKIYGGYHYALYLPDGPSQASCTDRAHLDSGPVAIALRQQHFVAYAWPASPEIGRKILAIDEKFNLYSAPYSGVPPQWDALFGNAGWNAGPSREWQPYRSSYDHP